MNLQKTILDFFVRYGAAFTTPEGETVHGCLSRVSGEDEPKELVHLPLGYRPAHRVRLLTQGDFPLPKTRPSLPAKRSTLWCWSGRKSWGKRCCTTSPSPMNRREIDAACHHPGGAYRPAGPAAQ